jgi:hypothetical protein
MDETPPVGSPETYSTKMAYDVAPLSVGVIVILVAVVVTVEFHAGAPPKTEMGPFMIIPSRGLLNPVQLYMRVLILPGMPELMRCAVTFAEKELGANSITKEGVPIIFPT